MKPFFLLHTVESRGGYQGTRTRLSPRAPFFQKMPWGLLFESFALSFCIVLFKADEPLIEPHLISSEASHMFFKIKQNLCVNMPKVAHQQL